MTELEQYYNKFCEEKRLNSRHGRVEFLTSMKYIHNYLDEEKQAKILDIGAGTGRYSVALAEEGYDVTAVAGKILPWHPKTEGQQCEGISGKCTESFPVFIRYI